MAYTHTQIISLFFDGLTGVFQDKLKAKHDITAHHMMYAVNVYSVLFLAVGMFLSGEGRDAAEFVQRHPHVILNILAFSLASAVGQVGLCVYIVVIVIVFTVKTYVQCFVCLFHYRTSYS